MANIYDVAKRARVSVSTVSAVVNDTTYVSRALAFDAIVLDDRDAAYEAVMHLVRLGYQRIGIINGLASVSSTRQRLAGYKKALRDARRPFVASLACHGDFRVESGYRGGLDI